MADNNKFNPIPAVRTADGSLTLSNEEIGEHYHSTHGALAESKHVFINAGMVYLIDKSDIKHIRLLEIGFGTGLNFLLTADAVIQSDVSLEYYALEPYPVHPEMIKSLDYGNHVNNHEIIDTFYDWYENPRVASPLLLDNVSLEIFKKKLLDFAPAQKYDLMYYDAFSPTVAPAMWNDESLEKVSSLLNPGGVLVTYCIRNFIKRKLRELEFETEALPGAPGKREMLRAIKK